MMATSGNSSTKGVSYDVNRRLVYNTIELGFGYEGLATLSSIMKMPCLTKGAYYKQLESIVAVLEVECSEEMKRVSANIHKMVLEENQEIDEGQPVDILVSFDGTWAKRGFTSLTGVVFVISTDTGEVLDCHVLSKSCQKCALKRSKCHDGDQFEQWRIKHEALNDCDINFKSSSQAMEAKGAKSVWERSLSTHNLRYRWMTCDGDSKAFSSVEDTYPDCKVEKLDCVGHV